MNTEVKTFEASSFSLPISANGRSFHFSLFKKRKKIRKREKEKVGAKKSGRKSVCGGKSRQTRERIMRRGWADEQASRSRAERVFRDRGRGQRKKRRGSVDGMEMRVRARTAWPGRGDRMRARRCQRRRRRRRHTTQPAESTPVNRRRTHGVYVYTRSKSRRLGSFRPLAKQTALLADARVSRFLHRSFNFTFTDWFPYPLCHWLRKLPLPFACMQMRLGRWLSRPPCLLVVVVSCTCSVSCPISKSKQWSITAVADFRGRVARSRGLQVAG